MEKSDFRQYIQFSNNLSRKRIQEFSLILGEHTVERIISLALYLVGGNRTQICAFLNKPLGTFFSFLTRFKGEGITALLDKRKKNPLALYQQAELNEQQVAYKFGMEIIHGDNNIQVHCDCLTPQITIQSQNRLQFKVLILTLTQSGIIKANHAAELLQISPRHVHNLCNDLSSHDVEALIDQRKGQQADYAFTPVVKGEIIQQYTAQVVSGDSVSSSTIAQQVNKACNTNLSERGFRYHISKMGLDRIKNSLPILLENVHK
jgi:hypothetical protein